MPKFELLHMVELLDQYMRDGRLQVADKSLMQVAYHDPCELSRLGGVIAEPRRVLTNSTVTWIDIPENQMDVRCCGGGGLLQAVDDPLRMKIAVKRLRQFEMAGTQLLTSACPACKITFMDAKDKVKSFVDVMDLVELVARQARLL